MIQIIKTGKEIDYNTVMSPCEVTVMSLCDVTVTSYM